MRLTARLAMPAALAVLLALVPATLLGHVEMLDSSPEAGSMLDSPPAEVTISFGEELDPQASGFTVSDAEGHVVGSGEVDLTVADRNVLSGSVQITEPGVYTVGYTVAGLDGHEIGGAFSFGVDTDEEIPSQPDTALPAPGNPLPSVLGVALLLSALAMLRRRLALAAPLVVLLALGATACVPSEQLPATCQQESVSLAATLDGDRLDPAAFDVCQDQQVTLAIAIERDGILHLHGYDDEVGAREVRAGEQVSLEFRATHPGQFPIALHTLEDSEELTVGSLTVHVP
jgi:methionine-rich copper-binding protein CopC